MENPSDQKCQQEVSIAFYSYRGIACRDCVKKAVDHRSCEGTKTDYVYVDYALAHPSVLGYVNFYSSSLTHLNAWNFVSVWCSRQLGEAHRQAPPRMVFWPCCFQFEQLEWVVA